MRWAPAFLLFLSVSAATAAQGTDSALPEGRRDAVEKLFLLGEGTHRPGYAYGVVVDERLVLAGGSGCADLETGRRIGPRTPFRLASTSKQFTAACALLLIEEGKLREDVSLGSVLPAFDHLDPAPSVADLIHHTSGIRDYLDLHGWRGEGEREEFTPRDSLALLAHQRALAFEPGSAFAYSNSNYFLLGEIVRQVSGTSLANFAQARVFGPLGMDASRFVDDHRETPGDAARGYWHGPDGWELYETELDHVGDGGVYSTIEDLARWAANFEAPRLGTGRPFLERFLSTRPLTDGRANTYAFGLDVEPLVGGAHLISHGGSFAGYRAALARDDATHTTAIVLANFPAARTEELAERILALMGANLARLPMPALDPPRYPPPGVPRDPESLAGPYSCSELDITWDLRPKGRGIEVSIGETPLIEFLPNRKGPGYHARGDRGTRLIPLRGASLALWNRYLGTLEFHSHQSQGQASGAASRQDR